jgi:hypothetical protein
MRSSGVLVACAAWIVGCSSAGNGAAPRADSGVEHDASEGGLPVIPVPLPNGAPGIGFDDLRYAPLLKKVLAPAGRSGNLDLVDTDTLVVTAIGGFSTSSTFMTGSHSSGCTSADEGAGPLYAIDHETQSVRVVDAASKTIVSSTMLAGAPDYVRWVASSNEIWVTEPMTGMEILTVPSGGAPAHAAMITVAGGPEAIAVDDTRHRVYTNSFVGTTYAIDIPTRAIVETWTNGCMGLSLGLALDEARGFLFVACSGGEIVVLDAAHGGAKLGQIMFNADFDILAYSASLHHLYVPGGTSADLFIVAVSDAGAPSLLGKAPTAQGSKEVTSDDRGNVWVADQAGGRLLKIVDTFPATP